MLATNRLSGIRSRRPSAQAGTAAVEFALLAIIFFTVVFGVLELARLMYVYNTLQEVTRRAAQEVVTMAPADPETPAMIAVRRRAIFQESGDGLMLAAPVAVKHIRIEYLSLTRDISDGRMKMKPTSPLPSIPANNHMTCMADPNDPACVRFVRVRICKPGAPGDCEAVRCQLIFPLVNLEVNLPRASTIATAESLGFLPGMTP
jgi:hypothetical protein